MKSGKNSLTIALLVMLYYKVTEDGEVRQSNGLKRIREGGSRKDDSGGKWAPEGEVKGRKPGSQDA